MEAAAGEITELLRKVRRGDPQAQGELWERLYPELHRLAHRYCGSERQGHTTLASHRFDDSEPGRYWPSCLT